MQLAPAQVEFFRANGYLAIPKLADEAELASLCELYARILADRRAFQVTFEGGGRLQQVMSPEVLYPELRETESFRTARALACQLLGIEGGELDGFFTHLIYKPMGEGRDTPWHQDEAYWDNAAFLAHSLSVWLPLDPVTVESGCMQFVPGSHAGDVLPHRYQAGVQPLTLDGEVDLSAAVACPLPAGGATFHHCRTLHYTGPNTSGVERRAWSLAFHAKPARRAAPVARPWLAGFLADTAKAALGS